MTNLEIQTTFNEDDISDMFENVCVGEWKNENKKYDSWIWK